MKNKKLVKVLVVLAIFIATLVVIIFWNILYIRHWKYSYYGNGEGIQVEILFTPTALRNSEVQGAADTDSYCEIWINQIRMPGFYTVFY